MECPACHSETRSGEKFCGTCGHKLEKECPECGASNPPAYNFCGRCGHNLGTSGSIALVRSGLIAEVDHKAATLLGRQSEEMTGKPFTLFMAREELPVFFSHWNELLRGADKQVLEAALNHKKGKKIYVLMECTLEKDPRTQVDLIHLNLHDISERRLALDQLQYQQDLLNLIFALADSIRTSTHRHLDASIVDALKKICLFTKADRSFIYTINRQDKRLELTHQWSQPSMGGANSKSKSVPLTVIKRSIVQLIRKNAYVVSNVAKLTPAERYELVAWHHADPGAVMCQLIYAHKQPVGVIGVAKIQATDEWPADCIALVKLFGQFLSDLQPFGALGHVQPEFAEQHQPAGARPAKSTKRKEPAAPSAQTDRDAPAHRTPEPARDLNASAQPTAAPGPMPLPNLGTPLLLEKMSDNQPLDRQTVFPRDDGLIVLTCPHCGLQESVSVGQFEKLGSAVKVQCPCHKRFAAVLEKRRAYRKAVNLAGFFTIAGEFGPYDTKASIWGPMVVQNISKTGLRFLSKRVDLIRPGDCLMVRFNLDNSNKALIHKQVEVISINGEGVGCRFKGADRYDITLGFYFI
jgi:PAS domain S-box-containing protein